MGKSTRKSSKIKILEKEMKYIQSCEGELCTLQKYNEILQHKQEFLKRLRNDKLDYICNLKDIHTPLEIEFFLQIIKVLFCYDQVLYNMSSTLEEYNASYENRNFNLEEIMSNYL